MTHLSIHVHAQLCGRVYFSLRCNRFLRDFGCGAGGTEESEVIPSRNADGDDSMSGNVRSSHTQTCNHTYRYYTNHTTQITTTRAFGFNNLHFQRTSASKEAIHTNQLCISAVTTPATFPTFPSSSFPLFPVFRVMCPLLHTCLSVTTLSHRYPKDSRLRWKLGSTPAPNPLAYQRPSILQHVGI